MLSEWLLSARLALEAFHPATPWVLITVKAWLAVYLLRRFAPSVWERLEAMGPDNQPAGRVFQALPSVLFGALASVALTGGDYQTTIKGAAFGALAPLIHHFMKAYQGAVGSGGNGGGSA